ncbi:MAG: ATP-binding protein [bacterium]
MSDAVATRTILLVDDDEMMHQLTRAFMEKFGYRCIFAFDGQEGLEKLLTHKPDLILLDYILPDMDGESIYQEILSNPTYEGCRDTPVIMLTARNRDSYTQNSLLQQGVSAYLYKPFGFHELKNVIENVLVMHEIQHRNKLLTQKVQQTKEYLELVLNAAPVGIFSTDKTGKIVQVNHCFSDYVDGLENPVGMNVLSQALFKRSELKVNFERCLNAGYAFEVEHLDLTPSLNKRKKINLRCVPLYSNGEISGCLGILEDITEAERRAYEFYTLSQISQAMQSTLDLDILLHLILTSITAGCALSFSRAMIFLYNTGQDCLRGRMGVGPTTAEDAHRIWSSLDQESNMSLAEFLIKYGKRKPDADDKFNNLVQSVCISLSASNNVLVDSFRNRRPIKVRKEERAKQGLEELYEKLSLEEFFSVPLIAEGKVLGIIVADNLYSDLPLDESRLELLTLFANQAALVVEKANAYKNIEDQKATLERTLDKLTKAQNQLIHSERLAAVGKMAAHVAHEIRNPLVTIGGFANSILKLTQEDENLKERASIIVNEVRRLENILSDILDFSKTQEIHFELANLNEVVEEACLLVKKECAANGIECVLELDDSIPEFPFDSEKIKQVMLNFLINAIQSLTGKQGKLVVKTRKLDGRQVEISIADNGTGIPRENLEKIFNPFFTTKHDGTGLGLAINEQIISDHRGRIRVKSEIEGGTKFSFTLPLEKKAAWDESPARVSPERKQTLVLS